MSSSQEVFNLLNKKFDTRKLVTCAILTALVIVLQAMGAFIRFGTFSVSLVLVPIVIGAAVCGIWTGAWLGFVFGLVVLFTDSALFMAVSPAGTIITVLLKGILAGLASAAVYRLAASANTTVGTVAAAFICPVVNTGVFLIGCNIFFMQTITQWGAAAGFDSAGKFLIFGMVGVNFLLELAVNMILSPILVRLISIRKKNV